MSKLRKLVSVIITLLALSGMAYGQGGNMGSTSSPITNRTGQPLSGIHISFCQPLATTAATVVSNVAVLTMASNPVTAGYVQGMTIQVAGFTGGDTYFNGGTYSAGVITGGYTILSVTATTVTYSLVHANASAGTNGTVLQQGNATTSCAGLSTVYANPTLTTTTTNPATSDGNGNWNVFATPGLYYAQFYGVGITTTIKQLAIACVPTGTCTTLSPLVIPGATSGSLAVTAPAIAGSSAIQIGVAANGTAAPTFPAATDTVVELTQTQTLTGKTLTSPIITNPATTGTDSGVATLVNKSLTSPSVSGTLAGSSLIQTGTTFTGASSGNNTTILNFQGALAATVGNSADKTYYTYSLPANTVAASKGIRITMYVQHTTGTANVSFKLSFGGTLTTSLLPVGSASQFVKLTYDIFNITTATQFLGSSETTDGDGLTITKINTSSVDTAAGATTINATFNVANTDQITPRAFFVELIQ